MSAIEFEASSASSMNRSLTSLVAYMCPHVPLSWGLHTAHGAGSAAMARAAAQGQPCVVPSG